MELLFDSIISGGVPLIFNNQVLASITTNNVACDTNALSGIGLPGNYSVAIDSGG